MRTRRSHKNQDRLFKAIGRDLARASVRSRRIEAMETALLEIEQFHNDRYPKCDGGCPAHEAMDKLRKALVAERNA